MNFVLRQRIPYLLAGPAKNDISNTRSYVQLIRTVEANSTGMPEILQLGTGTDVVQ
jgi:hypothetical protein